MALTFVKTRLLDREVKTKNETSDTSIKVLITGREDQSSNFKKIKVAHPKSKKLHRKSGKRNFKPKKNSSNLQCFHYAKKGHKLQDCH